METPVNLVSKAGIVELVLKHIFDDDLLPFLNSLIKELQALEQAGDSAIVTQVLKYSLCRGRIVDTKELNALINNNFSDEVKEEVMTLLDVIISRMHSYPIIIGFYIFKYCTFCFLPNLKVFMVN